MARSDQRKPLLSALVALSALLAVAGCGSGDAGTAAAPQRAPSLRNQAGQLLGGGPRAFDAQLAKLRGTPVVVNQWASWCGPCRFEFPFFARLATRYRGRVAFLGVDAQDSREAAQRFLRELPTPFPHFFDPTTAIARRFRGGVAWPTTAFYDASGRLVFTHFGGYPSQAALDRDIRVHALGR